jgi:hypothetical protein
MIFYEVSASSILKKNALNNRELAYLTIIIKYEKGLFLIIVNMFKISFSKKNFVTIILLFIWLVLNCYVL